MVSNVLNRIENFVTVLSSELNPFPLEIILSGLIWFAGLYFFSRWFRAYIIRLILFAVGVSIFYSVMGRSHIISSVDLYAGLGLSLPHIEIVEITYLIIREKTLFLVDKIIELFYLIISPFVWVYNLFLNIFQFLKMKQEQREDRKAEKEFYKEEFKKEQKRAYQEEQQKYDEAERKRQEQNQQKKEKTYHYKKKQKKEQQQNQEQEPKQEEKPKEYSRWDSSNPYEVLGINENATAKEIKKAYRNLSKIYHPDLTLTKKEEHTIIFQKISGAYDSLK